ncbi:hypothetical protein AVEN_149780-1 [Araneus ventricosus]|uniref:Uncharacterized protein n=1 Tax=Araneus ventricosus TaxID=182803 RepID=A0A4Y2KAN4_ARAVE|nr:hypothetical protein AVEN_149780-1 [Araneus ventricosus]
MLVLNISNYLENKESNYRNQRTNLRRADSCQWRGCGHLVVESSVQKSLFVRDKISPEIFRLGLMHFRSLWVKHSIVKVEGNFWGASTPTRWRPPHGSKLHCVPENSHVASSKIPGFKTKGGRFL